MLREKIVKRMRYIVITAGILTLLAGLTGGANPAAGYAQTLGKDKASDKKQELTMKDILLQKRWDNLTPIYFKTFRNAVVEKNKEEYVLNSNIIIKVVYQKENYELQISYLKKNSCIDGILLVRKSDSQAILLYSDNPQYKINTDVKSFLKTKVRMSDYLTYTLPASFTNDKYSAVLGNGGGNLFLKNRKKPKSTGFVPIEWISPGGVLRLSDADWGDVLEAEEHNYVVFQKGKLKSGSLHNNHTEYIGKPIVLKGLKEQAVIMEAEHDLYTASEIYEASSKGKPIPVKEQTGILYEIYFARENSQISYCIFLNKKYFTLEEAKTLAKSVKFTKAAFQ